jgi:hypothetical protein
MTRTAYRMVMETKALRFGECEFDIASRESGCGDETELDADITEAQTS